MKKHLSFFLLCGAVLFFLWNGYDAVSSRKKKGPPLLISHLSDIEYRVTQERPFVILVPSYNNEKYFRANLASIFDQEYDNFRIIYMDDASTDGTKEGVLQWLKTEKRKNLATFISNAKRCGALENLYRAIGECKDNEILVFLDGDDALAHPKVLRWLNLVYEDPYVWMTYGSYLESPLYRRGPDGAIDREIHEKGSYRKAFEKSFLASHLRTGYGGLFKQISLNDVLDEGGRFFSSSADRALMWPALEMARSHARYIKDVLYIYNRNNVINDDKVDVDLQIACREKIRQKTPRHALSSWHLPSPEVDLVFESQGNLIESLLSLKGLQKSTDQLRAVWIIEKNPTLGKLFCSQGSSLIKWVQSKEELREEPLSEYLFCVKAGALPCENISLREYAKLCKARGAQRLYFEKGEKTPVHLCQSSFFQEKLPIRLLQKQDFIQSLDHKQGIDLAVSHPWVEIQGAL